MGMQLRRAVEADYPSIVELVNLAFRAAGPSASWNSEASFIEGDRLDETLLREEIAQHPEAHLLVARDELNGSLLGTVWLEPKEYALWYLGLLTIRLDLQDRGLGRVLLSAAEAYVQERGALRMGMTVVNVRDTLIDWYVRRGYTLTVETRPFPYDSQRFGRPLRNDLHFVVLEKRFNFVGSDCGGFLPRQTHDKLCFSRF